MAAEVLSSGGADDLATTVNCICDGFAARRKRWQSAHFAIAVERSEGGDQDADSSVAVPERKDHEGAIVVRSTVSCYRMSRVSDPA